METSHLAEATLGILNWVRGKKLFKVVCFFTPHNEYAEMATRLRKTLDALKIQHNIVPLEIDGHWEMVCAAKARFIKEQLEQSDIPIVWLDADATVESYPKLFDDLKCDFAIHKWEGWQFSSGTLYFGKTEGALALINQWIVRCEADPMTWDQTHLQSAWCDINALRPLNTEWLPRSYLQIFDAREDEAPVIRHWQASRAVRESGRSAGIPQLVYTERGKEMRRLNQLWRTQEEAFWISEGTQHIKPELGYDFPEGFDVREALNRSIDGLFPFVEIGCGVGRIASLFEPAEYVGVDVNPNAIRQAKESLPHHLFRIFDDGMEYPPAPTALVYTVLLHISDEAIQQMLSQIVVGRDQVVLAELMDSRWRRDGNPPVFNRDPETYILLMRELGFALKSCEKLAYERYDKEPWNIGKDSRITFLRFHKDELR